MLNFGVGFLREFQEMILLAAPALFVCGLWRVWIGPLALSALAERGGEVRRLS